VPRILIGPVGVKDTALLWKPGGNGCSLEFVGTGLLAGELRKSAPVCRSW
jgi:hypothetical protein